MKPWTSKQYMLAAALLLLVSNVFVLAGVAYNRSGDPIAKITLTERELSSPYSYSYRREDSGVAFYLQWRVHSDQTRYSSYGYYSGAYTPVSWLDKAKLDQLGFDTSFDPKQKGAYRVYNNLPEREVFLVLEYDGESYQRALKLAEENLFEKESLLESMPKDISKQEKTRIENNAKSARNFLEQEQNSRTRLFVIDADVNDELLRKKYADQDRYLVVKGKVGVSIQSIDKKSVLRGRITEILNNRIHIPLPFRDQLVEFSKTKKYRKYQGKKPRFQGTFAWGKRYEPWIVGVSMLE
ncbi:MAG: DUF4824 family protein [Gammaproteobacteria bacterium]|jgi:hypothetical protein